MVETITINDMVLVWKLKVSSFNASKIVKKDYIRENCFLPPEEKYVQKAIETSVPKEEKEPEASEEWKAVKKRKRENNHHGKKETKMPVLPNLVVPCPNPTRTDSLHFTSDMETYEPANTQEEPSRPIAKLL